jgi:hypothetical protein
MMRPCFEFRGAAWCQGQKRWCGAQDERELGRRPQSYAECEEVLARSRYHVTRTTLPSGLHRARADARIAVVTKHVCPALAVLIVRRCSHLQSSNAASAGPSSQHAAAFAPTQTPCLHTSPGGHRSLRRHAVAEAPPPFDVPALGRGCVVEQRPSQMRLQPLPSGGFTLRLPAAPSAGRRRARRQSAHAVPLPGLICQIWDSWVEPAVRDGWHDTGAFCVLFVHVKGVPMYGSELFDAALAQHAFDALREVHAVAIHGDVTTANIVWDASGHYFQFVDLEFATWQEGPARVVSPALVVPPLMTPLREPRSEAPCQPHTCRADQSSETDTALGLRAAPGRAGRLLCEAHGSTATTRLAAHGTYEFCSINQLLGCWPCRADDVVSLFWSTVRQHCPRSLWWGGLQLSKLLGDAESRLEEGMGQQEEAVLLAFAQVWPAPKRGSLLVPWLPLTIDVHSSTFSPFPSARPRMLEGALNHVAL